VLLRDVPREKRRYWKWRWKQIAPGHASDREMRSTMGGLFRFFVHRLHCNIVSSREGTLFRFDSPGR
jgi:hypothetical protein